MIKIKIKSIWGSLLFEYTKENNTIKDTIQEAVNKGANLEGAYLYGANLEGAYLKGAYLKGAYLEGAYLKGANLEGDNLEGANLEGANLKGAYLYGANLYGAYLEGDNLEGANLEGANLEGANLKGAYLKGAYLYGANLYGANLEGANLEGANHIHLLNNLPEGDIIGWKKVNGILIKLLIPKDAKRCHAIGYRKCRAEFADVLEVNCEGEEILNTNYKHKVLYKTGTRVHPDSYCDDVRIECGQGINFFISKQEALDY